MLSNSPMKKLNRGFKEFVNACKRKNWYCC